MSAKSVIEYLNGHVDGNFLLCPCEKAILNLENNERNGPVYDNTLCSVCEEFVCQECTYNGKLEDPICKQCADKLPTCSQCSKKSQIRDSETVCCNKLRTWCDDCECNCICCVTCRQYNCKSKKCKKIAKVKAKYKKALESIQNED